MDYVIYNHNFTDDIVSVLMLFFPNSTYTRQTLPTENCITSQMTESSIITALYLNGKIINEDISPVSQNPKEIKKAVALSLFKALQGHYNRALPWGALTGVRPAKLATELLNNHTRQEAESILKNKYFLRQDKIDLAIEVSQREKLILQQSDPNSVGLYIGIPFCPTRCLYCSFTSYPLKQYASKVDLYLDKLELELALCGRNLASTPVESVYIGGGTPTSLSPAQLNRLLTAVFRSFTPTREFTVEAGRPDTITEEKLEIIKSFGINRISINPQTLNNKTLRLIGRQHTTEDFYNAFNTARKLNINHINCDVILGLPDEGIEEVTATFKGLKALSPESLTVHTLAVKRASRLKETLECYSLADFENMDKQLSLSIKYAREMGMHPYYMYRQKNMVGNFENVSYCKPNHECIYNIQIMEETQTIIACGCGGSTKTVNKQNGRIERIFNVKSVDDYINRTDEMLDRKIKGLGWQ